MLVVPLCYRLHSHSLQTSPSWVFYPGKLCQRALQHVHGLVDFLLRDYEARDEPKRVPPAREEEHAFLAAHLCDLAWKSRICQWQTEDEAGTADFRGHQARELEGKRCEPLVQMRGDSVDVREEVGLADAGQNVVRHSSLKRRAPVQRDGSFRTSATTYKGRVPL